MSLSDLNKAQREAVEYNDGNLLIVAGAGTGKTTVITEKIVALIEKGYAKPEEILALTFTEKAASEMQERVDKRLEVGYLDLHISTFHAFGQRILEEHGLAIGLPDTFSLLTQTDAWLLLRKHIYDLELDYYRPLGNPSRHLHSLIDHFSKCKDELLSPAEYIEYANNLALDDDKIHTEEKTRIKELARVYHVYNDLLLQNDSLDFADLIYYSVKLLRDRENIRENLQKRFKYILVDEFQDVNYAQYELVKLLSEKSKLTVVGDDDQSIYAFRGASVSNILRFKDDFPTAKEVVLNENYRSRQEILDVAYASIQHNNPNRLEVKLGLDKKLSARKYPAEAKNIVSVTHFHTANGGEEVKTVLEEIVRLKSIYSDAVWDDFAILVRANNHAEPIMNAFEKAGIPYEFLASSGLFRQPIVMNVASFFQLLVDPHENTALYRLLRLSVWELPDEDIQRIMFLAKKKSLSFYDALQKCREFHLSPAIIQFADRFLTLVQECLRLSQKEKPTTVAYKFLEKSGYLSFLTHAEVEGNAEVIRETYQLKQFFEFIAAYEEANPGATVVQLLQHMKYLTDSGDEGSLYQPTDTPDSVNILTVHSAKGLEFRFVFIMNLVEERFPTRKRGEKMELPSELIHEKSIDGETHYQEERRLFYVAMTRAKERLYFTSASNYGGVREKKLSRFLAEIGYSIQDNAEKQTTKTKKEPKKTVEPFSLQLQKSYTEENTVLTYKAPKTFSYSQIECYETCPYKYKLAHIIKIPTKGSGSLSFGSTLHRTLQWFYEKVQLDNSVKQQTLFATLDTSERSGAVKVPTLTELLQMYEKAWISDWYESRQQREKYYEKGKEILKLFYAANEGVWGIPLALESSFKIKVGDALIQGRIDRIDKLADGTLEIIDYKTGETKETLESNDKNQLLIYQIATESLPEYKFIGKTSKLTFYFLRGGVKTSFIGQSKDLLRIKEKLQAVTAAIQAGEFTATPGPFACQNCNFRDICEFRQL